MAKTRTRTSLIQQSRRVSPMEKALTHNVVGAGKAHVKREFFDLNTDDLSAITEELDRRVERNLRTQGET